MSQTLLILTGKRYKREATQQICIFCNQRATENELQILIDCPNYEELRIDTFSSIAKIDNVNLKHGNKIKKLKQLFYIGSFRSLNLLGKLINNTMKKWNKTVKSIFCKENKNKQINEKKCK